MNRITFFAPKMGKKTSFSFKNEMKIIDFVKHNDVLYNVNHENFRDTEEKNRLWLNLANELNAEGNC